LTDLNKYRSDIEEVDQSIIELIDKRIGITKRIFEVKRREGRPIRDPEQESRVLRRAMDLATEKNLDAGAVKKYLRDSDQYEHPKAARASGRESKLSSR